MGTLYQFATVLIFPLLLGSSAWIAPAAASQTSTALQISTALQTSTASQASTLASGSVVANQPYEPPDNGGPDGTIGSGTR